MTANMPNGTGDSSGATRNIPLSPFDNVMARYYGKFIIGFSIEPRKSPDTVFEYLERSFSATIEQLPFLAGRLALRSPSPTHTAYGELEIRLSTNPDNKYMPRLQRKDLGLEIDYQDIMDEGLPESTLDGELLLPAAFRPDLENGADILVAQCNFVQGGCFLGVGLYHSVCDGSGLNTIMKLWAENCRLLQTEDRVNHRFALGPESFDRGLLKKVWLAEGNEEIEAEAVDTAEGLWRLLGLNPMSLSNTKESFAPDAPSKASFSGFPTMETGIFYVSRASFAKLKASVSSNTVDQDENLSANDALTALLWRCIMKARVRQEDPDLANLTAVLDTTVDGRAQFSEKLPPSYLGNIILINTARLAASQLTAPSTPLSQIARDVRKSLNQITRSRVHSAFAIASCIPDYTRLTFPFATFEGAEVCITSLLNIPLFELNFGPAFGNDGRPESVRPPREEFDKICRRVMVLPLRTHGGFEIMITLMDHEMQKLRKDPEFTEYAKFCCN